MCMLISFSVDEILILRYLVRSANFSRLLFNEEKAPSWLKRYENNKQHCLSKNFSAYWTCFCCGYYISVYVLYIFLQMYKKRFLFLNKNILKNSRFSQRWNTVLTSIQVLSLFGQLGIGCRTGKVTLGERIASCHVSHFPFVEKYPVCFSFTTDFYGFIGSVKKSICSF